MTVLTKTSSLILFSLIIYISTIFIFGYFPEIVKLLDISYFSTMNERKIFIFDELYLQTLFLSLNILGYLIFSIIFIFKNKLVSIQIFILSSFSSAFFLSIILYIFLWSFLADIIPSKNDPKGFMVIIFILITAPIFQYYFSKMLYIFHENRKYRFIVYVLYSILLLNFITWLLVGRNSNLLLETDSVEFYYNADLIGIVKENDKLPWYSSAPNNYSISTQEMYFAIIGKNSKKLEYLTNNTYNDFFKSELSYERYMVETACFRIIPFYSYISSNLFAWPEGNGRTVKYIWFFKWIRIGFINSWVA